MFLEAISESKTLYTSLNYHGNLPADDNFLFLPNFLQKYFLMEVYDGSKQIIKNTDEKSISIIVKYMISIGKAVKRSNNSIVKLLPNKISSSITISNDYEESIISDTDVAYLCLKASIIALETKIQRSLDKIQEYTKKATKYNVSVVCCIRTF
jgi:hypothetical protein